MNFICLNGRILPADQPAFRADNKSYRYGDGLFETLRMTHKKIGLESYHFERFFSGMDTLGFRIPPHFSADKIKQDILKLCEQNHCEKMARIRLSASRGNGGLYEEKNELTCLIECWPASETTNELNENGLVIDIYPDARKMSDGLSHLKSANFLPYVMAARYARENKWNDCLLLNQHGRIADATIANIFLIKDGVLFTPPLTEGAVAGVMRRHLITTSPVTEKPLSLLDLEEADELFLTNAMYGIRWVRQFRNKNYDHAQTFSIYKRLVRTIWE